MLTILPQSSAQIHFCPCHHDPGRAEAALAAIASIVLDIGLDPGIGGWVRQDGAQIKTMDGNMKQQQMHHRLPFRPQLAMSKMGVQIAGLRGGLKEYHGDIPYRRRTAQQGPHHPGKHWLHPNQQQGAQTQYHGVKCQHMKLNQ